MQCLFEWCYHQSVISWSLISLAANFAMAGASVVGCWFLSRLFRERRIFEAPQPLVASDILYAIGAVVLNSAIAVVGWMLWKWGWIGLHPASPVRTIADAILLIGVMDFAMYVLHWLAHWPMFFKIIHQSHHAHESTNPLSLFVLNPFEVLGFGFLLVAVLVVFPLSEGALVVYLFFNLVFGTIGHLGVEPLPEWALRSPLFRYLGTSTFHGLHHADRAHNFGFYTTVWDRLFHTLHPQYDEHVFSNLSHS